MLAQRLFKLPALAGDDRYLYLKDYVQNQAREPRFRFAEKPDRTSCDRSGAHSLWAFGISAHSWFLDDPAWARHTFDRCSGRAQVAPPSPGAAWPMAQDSLSIACGAIGILKWQEAGLVLHDNGACGSWRPRPDSNRSTRICSPLRSHSATRPWAAYSPSARKRQLGGVGQMQHAICSTAWLSLSLTTAGS
jgi:hypothetical protein